MGYYNELKNIFEGENLSEKKQAVSVVFALLNTLASELKEEQDRLGKPRFLKKQMDKAKKITENDELIQAATEQYLEAKSSQSALGHKRDFLKSLQKELKKLSTTIKRG
jgi:hypothetical protein